MPSASMRAVTSAEEPAGNSTVISSGLRCGKSCALAAGSEEAKNDQETFHVSISSTSTLRPSRADLMPARITASERGRALAVHLGLRLAAHRGGELVQLVDDGVVLLGGNPLRLVRAALLQAQPAVQVVVGGRFLAVDVHQVVLAGRGIARVERRLRAVLVLEDQAGDVRVVARQHELHEAPADRLDRAEQVLEHVGVVDADLQHHAAGHAGGLVAPGVEVDLAQPVAADVGFRVHQLAELALDDLLLDQPEVGFAPPLVAEGENHLGIAARLGEGAGVGDRVGDRLVEKDMLACGRRGARRLQVRGIRRGVDDRLDALIAQYFFVGVGRACSCISPRTSAFLSAVRL